jgi:hypothetical protein
MLSDQVSVVGTSYDVYYLLLRMLYICMLSGVLDLVFKVW